MMMINHEDEFSKQGLQVMKISLQEKHHGDTCYEGDGSQTVVTDMLKKLPGQFSSGATGDGRFTSSS